MNISQRKVKNNIIELEERNETDRRSADPHADTDACGVWAVEAAAHDPVGVEEAEGAEISQREEKKRCRICGGCDNHCSLDPGEKPCKEKSAAGREPKQADQRNKSLAYSIGAEGGKVK